jgi:hypothetical protein
VAEGRQRVDRDRRPLIAEIRHGHPFVAGVGADRHTV